MQFTLIFNFHHRRIPNQLHSILQSISSHINSLELADKHEVLISDLTRGSAINVESTQIIRTYYISNLRWQAENYHLITHWFDTWNLQENVDDASGTLISSILVIAFGILINFICNFY